MTPQPDPQMNWQPMESAPEVGKFLVYLEKDMLGNRIHAANWGLNMKTIGSLFHYDCPNPTHWMPLPEPPNSQPDPQNTL